MIMRSTVFCEGRKAVNDEVKETRRSAAGQDKTDEKAAYVKQSIQTPFLFARPYTNAGIRAEVLSDVCIVEYLRRIGINMFTDHSLETTTVIP